MRPLLDSSSAPIGFALAFAVATICSIDWRIRTGRRVATVIAVVSALLCLLELMAWAAWYI